MKAILSALGGIFLFAGVLADCRADLLNAIQSGNADQVREYLSQNPALLDARVLNGVTPLQSAIDGRQPEIAKLLIRSGADIHLPFADGNSPLGHAAYLDQDGVVDLLLSMEKPADAPVQMSRALEMAILNGSLKVTTLLIARGANANPPDSRPLLTAVSNNRQQIARLLLAHGANCGFRDVNGNTLLHYPPAGHGKDARLEFVDMFIACGVDVNARNNLGETPLFVALNFGSDGLPLVERLIAKGADVNARNKGAWTPLLHAAYIGKLDPETLRFLIKHGADTNARDHEGMGLLHDLAGSIGPVNVETVALAIKLGADVNAKAGSREQRSTEGYTPLHMAAYAGHAEIGELLIARGAKLNELNAAHQTPLMLALQRDRADFARMLIKHGADVKTSQSGQPTPLGLAVSRNDVETTRLLLARGADVEAGGGMDRPLILAVRGGNLELARLLIAKGADVNAQGGGMTALHWAARDGREELTRLLLDHGASVSAKNGSGQTPIQVAAQSIVALLAAKGAARPQVADPALAEQACKMVVARANNGTLRNLLGTPDSGRRFMRNFDGNETDPELESVDGLFRIESGGSQYILGMAGQKPIYLARPGARQGEEVVCRIGREDKLYFARTRGETAALSHLVHPEYGLTDRTPAFPADLPRALVQAAPADVKFELYDRRLLPVGWSLSGPAAREARGTTYLSGGRYAFSPDRSEAYLLDRDQFIVVDMKTGATSHFALPAGFPPIENATDLAYDARRNVVSVATLGGEGFFYRFDVKTHRWLDFHSFNDIDAISLAYDKVADRYLAWTTDAELLLISAHGEIGTRQALGEKLPGFYRLYPKDYTQDHLVDLKPRGIHLALVVYRNGKVQGVWHYNIESGKGTLTYK